MKQQLQQEQQQQETAWIIESSFRVFCCILLYISKRKKCEIKSIVYEPRERVCNAHNMINVETLDFNSIRNDISHQSEPKKKKKNETTYLKLILQC